MFEKKKKKKNSLVNVFYGMGKICRLIDGGIASQNSSGILFKKVLKKNKENVYNNDRVIL